MSLSLRLRLPSGPPATIGVAPDAPLAELLGIIADAAGVDASTLKLSAGFPPQALTLEGDAPVSSKLQHMDTIMVTTSTPAPANVPPKSARGRGRGRASGSNSGRAASGSPAAGRGGVVTLADVSGGSSASARKRPATSNSGSSRPGGGGGGGGKRRAVGALQLGSEEGIGASLLGAVSTKKSTLHSEDPAGAFLKAAASSALAHHVEEVHANERFQAALGGSCEYIDSDVGRRLDGEPTQCDVKFKVGRAMRIESFALLSRPELREVLRTVLRQADDAVHLDDAAGAEEGRPASVELLKPFKMAHASPRVFWNLAREFGGDVAGGLRQLLPQQDWSFLEEREKKRSGKAIANERVAAEEAAAKAERAAKRQQKAAAKAAAESGQPLGDEDAAAIGPDPDTHVSGVAVEGEVQRHPRRGEQAEVEEAEGEAEEVEEEVQGPPEEPDDDDADGWESLGKKAMIEDREYDYACACLDRALQIRIDERGGREAADRDATMALPWYLHGSALLRRAQALAHTIAVSEGPVETSATASGTTVLSASIDKAADALPAVWQTSGSAAIGRRTRRFFALHGAADGTVIAWQPPVTKAGAATSSAIDVTDADNGQEEAEEEEEEALYRIVMDDGDVEDVDEAELDEALSAHREGRGVSDEIDELLEAAWEALEMAASLYAVSPVNQLGGAEAHERLGDCALQNEQPERALEEYTQAHVLLDALKSEGTLLPEDRRLADIEWFLGITHLQLGRAAEAMRHYRQASATLRLRQAILQRREQDRTIARLSQEAASGMSDGGGAPMAAGSAASAGNGGADEDSDEIAEIGELLSEIESRIAEVQRAQAATA